MFRPYWQFTPSAYGFMFTLLAKYLCAAGQGDWWLTLCIFRAVNAVAFGLLGCTVWACCRRLGFPHPERALYLLLWNPLLLITGIVHGHNDILMALFSTAAIYCALGRGWPLVMPALMTATLVKILTAPLLPLGFLMLARRQGRTKAVLSAALALLPGVALPWLYLGDGQGLRLTRCIENYSELHNSLTATLGHAFEEVAKVFPPLAAHYTQWTSTIKLASWGLFAAFYAGVAWRWLRNRGCNATTLLRDLVLVHFILVCLISSKFYPWYMGMFLPLAILLPAGDWLRRAVLAVSCGQVLSLTFINTAHFLNVLLMLLLPMLAARCLAPPSMLNIGAHDGRRPLRFVAPPPPHVASISRPEGP